MTDPRFVFFHKQPTSARMRFLVFETGSVMSGPALPQLSILEEVERDYDDEDVLQFPANGLGDILSTLNLERTDAEMAFPDIAAVETAAETIPVHGIKADRDRPAF